VPLRDGSERQDQPVGVMHVGARQVDVIDSYQVERMR